MNLCLQLLITRKFLYCIQNIFSQIALLDEVRRVLTFSQSSYKIYKIRDLKKYPNSTYNY